MPKLSPDEIQRTENIFMLQISLDLLKQGRRPFHDQAIAMIKREIKKMKKYYDKV